MTTKTISGTTITTGYVLSASFTALSIASTGAVGGTAGAAGTDAGSSHVNGGPGGAGGVGVSIPFSATVINYGSIIGGAGGAGGLGSGYGSSYHSGAGGAGGIGLTLAAGGTLTNANVITGGAGGKGGGTSSAGYGGAGGVGGVAVRVTGAAVLASTGAITGGAGGTGGTGNQDPGLAGVGGAGVVLTGAETFTNSGAITGGAGGASGFGSIFYIWPAAGTGGVGFDLAASGGSLINNGTITGGVGGASGGGFIGATGGGGVGGVGVYIASGAHVSGTGKIVGGTGGAGDSGGGKIAATRGGTGGIAVVVAGGTFTAGVALTGGVGGVGGPGAGTNTIGGHGAVGGDGGAGLAIVGTGEVINYATIAGGAGGAGGAGTIGNGSAGVTGVGATTTLGGVVVNGSAALTASLISGGEGVSLGGTIAATVTNFGTIKGTAGYRSFNYKDAFHSNGAVLLAHGGLVTNGTATDAAQIVGYTGIYGVGGALTVNNFGTVNGTGLSGFTNDKGAGGVRLMDGGAVTNGASGHATALIEGFFGVYAGAAAAVTVTNFGTLEGTSDAVEFKSSSDRLIAEGGSSLVGSVAGGGGILELAAGTGTIGGLGVTTTGFAEYLVDAGANWTLSGTNTISTAVVDNGALSVATSLTLLSSIDSVGGTGVTLLSGAVLNNGAVASTKAFIGGVTGVYATDFGTVHNFGTLAGSGVTNSTAAITLHNNGLFDNYAGAQALGFNGVRMASGAHVINSGTLQGFNSAGVYVTAGEGYVTNQASGLIEGANYGVWTNSATTITNAGLISGGVRSVRFGVTSDRLIVETGGKFTGAITGGGGTLELDTGPGTITGLGATGTLSGGVSAVFSGFGTYIVDSGESWTLTGTNTLSAGQKLTNNGTLTIAASSHLTVGGSLVNGGMIAVKGGTGSTFASLQFSGVETLSGGGTVSLNATGYIGGVGASLTNLNNTIEGGGIIKSVTLTNEGTIDNNVGRMILNTGGTVTNDGLIEPTGTGTLLVRNTTVDSSGGGIVTDSRLILLSKATLAGGLLSINAKAVLINDALGGTVNLAGGTVSNAGDIYGVAGGLTIDGAVANNGLIEARSGKLTITGAVSGTGSARVVGTGVLELDGTFGQNVFMAAGSTGELVIGDAVGFTGRVYGLSYTGANRIDLKGIAYNGADILTYAGSKIGGTLTLETSAHAVLATIKLTGDYITNSNFSFADDKAGGTVIKDPPLTTALTTAMASFGAGGGLPGGATATGAPTPPVLASPTG